MLTTRLFLARQRQTGLSLLESLFCIALSLTLLTLTGSAFIGIVHSSRRHAQINELVASLHQARNQAILRNSPIVMCTTPQGRECENHAAWHQGWMIFTDPDRNASCNSADGFLCEDGGEILMFRLPSEDIHGRIVANRHNQPIRFGINGFSEGSNRSFVVCGALRLPQAEQIILSRTGRVRREPASSSTSCLDSSDT